jgi:Flp pilus assembly protein TadG
MQPHSMELKRLIRRRGSATLWMVMWLPCLMALFCVLVGVANLWLSRVELENAMEAAALAAVKEWGADPGAGTLPARSVGVAYAQANLVRGQGVTIDDNFNAGGANENDQCVPQMSPPRGNLVFGSIDSSDPSNVVFAAGGNPSCGQGNERFAVRAQAIMPLSAPGFAPFLGNVTMYCVQAKATAEYDCATGRVRLVRVDSFVCP